jgi:hypothetical protein
MLNKTNNTQKASACQKVGILIAIIFVSFIAACGKSKTEKVEVAEVISSVPGQTERPLIDSARIRHIYPNGNVCIGTLEMSPTSGIKTRPTAFGDKTLKLEGQAAINDLATLVIHYEDQVLSSGEVRRVIVSYSVKSRRQLPDGTLPKK